MLAVLFVKYNWNETFGVSQVTELAGYTARVYNMFSVFDEVKRGIYKRTAVIQGSENNSKNEDKAELHIDGPLEIKGNSFIFVCLFLCVRPVPWDRRWTEVFFLQQINLSALDPTDHVAFQFILLLFCKSVLMQ